MLVNETIQSLHGGVSGQNIELRRDTQVEEMVNCLPTLALGLRRRNPTRNLIDTEPHSDKQWMYTYDRGLQGTNTEQYVITIEEGSNELKVMDKDGIFRTVTYEGNSQSYIANNSGARSFSAITIKDTTIIVNKDKLVESEDSIGDDAWKSKAYVWVKQVDYNYPITTTITLDGTTYTATYPANTSSTEVAAEAIRVVANNASGFTATRKGSIVEIVKTNKEELAFTYSDTIGDSAGSGWCKNVQLISDLPKDAKYEGVIVRVTNSAGTDEDDYYIKFEDGTWIETLNPEYPSFINADTMPHELIRIDDTFTFKAREWIGRTKGDDITSPNPKFVDDYIKDLYFIKNRLGFITRTDFDMSEVGEYGNFFRTTTLSLLDSDPISFVPDSTEAVNMEYCAFLQSSLIAFSDKQQFKIDGGNILSPNSVQAQVVTAYNIDTGCRPLSINNKLFFVVRGDRFSSVIEYFKDTRSSNVDGQNISEQIPQYIPNNIKALVGSSKHNMLFLLPQPIANTVNNTIYVYKYYYEGNELVQSAWFKWSINGDIYSIESLDDKLMIMCRRRPFGNTEFWEDNTFWEDESLWTEDIVYDTIETIELDPLDISDDFRDNVKINDDSEAQRYQSKVVLSEWMLKIDNKKRIHGHHDFRTIQINSAEDSDYTLVIKNNNRNKRRELLNKYVVGRKPYVYGKAKDVKIEIISNEAVGFQLGTITYEGSYTARGKSIN